METPTSSEKMTNNKTPVMILEEFLAKERFPRPLYTFMPEETVNDRKVFVCEVTSADYTAIGRGKNKQEAKHGAASEILKLMKSAPKASTTGGSGSNDQGKKSKADDYVSQLQMICSAKKFPPPKFDEPKTEVTVQCQIATLVREGKAATKKEAKQLAAQQMLEAIEKICKDPELMQLVIAAGALPKE